MNKSILTQEIAYAAIQNFFSVKPFVLFATGTSCAVDINFGMWSLEQWLKKQIPSLPLSDSQMLEWDGVILALGKSKDFEAAMNSINDEELLSAVITKTAEHVLAVDGANASEILLGTKEWPAINLFSRLVNALPAENRVLHVATPNYDMLAEYAFTNAGLNYITGFWGGVIRQLDWLQSERKMTYAEDVLVGKRSQRTTRLKNHIRLYKVHGSLNTYVFNGNVIETDLWDEPPEEIERLMITPGASKYERLHEYRGALLAEYDKAIKSHQSFLFLGFGFNDKQLVNNTIVDKLRNKKSPALIITRDSNDRVEAIVKESANTWLVCKSEIDDSTRICNCQYADWLVLPGKQLWQFDKFVTEILGE